MPILLSPARTLTTRESVTLRIMTLRAVYLRNRDIKSEYEITERLWLSKPLREAVLPMFQPSWTVCQDPTLWTSGHRVWKGLCKAKEILCHVMLDDSLYLLLLCMTKCLFCGDIIPPETSSLPNKTCTSSTKIKCCMVMLQCGLLTKPLMFVFSQGTCPTFIVHWRS